MVDLRASAATATCSSTSRQVGASAGEGRRGTVGWNGREIVAFRLHLPSKIRYHNARPRGRRGNILVWEQPLADRLRGAPLELEARMEPQSILYRTLWLFGIDLHRGRHRVRVW